MEKIEFILPIFRLKKTFCRGERVTHVLITSQVTVSYHMAGQKWNLAFGMCKPASVSNCHTLLVYQLQRMLNETYSVTKLAQILIDTWSPMATIGKLSSAPRMAVTTVS